MRILVVEDESVMAEVLRRGLEREGYAVDVAADGAVALECIAVHHYDVVLLDRDLPEVHGDEVCRHLNASGSPARILMLTAAGDLDEMVEGFGLGADDYVSKPFRLPELLARVEVLARRTAPTLSPVLRSGDLAIDTARRVVCRAGSVLDLTPKEYGVLVELARAQGALVSAESLLERVWDEHADPFTNAVRVTLVNLRRKLGEPALIETVRGMGYRLPS